MNESISRSAGARISAIQLAIAYTPEGAAAATGRSRSRIFKAISEKELTARKDGKATIIEDAELRRWVHSLPAIGREATAAA